MAAKVFDEGKRTVDVSAQALYLFHTTVSGNCVVCLKKNMKLLLLLFVFPCYCVGKANANS